MRATNYVKLIFLFKTMLMQPAQQTTNNLLYWRVWIALNQGGLSDAFLLGQKYRYFDNFLQIG